MSEALFSLLRIGVAVYVGLCLVLMFRQSRYIYFPDRDVSLTPEYLDLDYENVSIRTQDGESIIGWYVPVDPLEAPGARPTVLFCHGNGGDIGDRVGSLKTFHDMGFNTLIFDYRGYGQSTGKPSEQGTYLDVQAAWNHLKAVRGVPPAQIILFGRSLGGAVAVWIATQVNAGALVIESTLTSAPDMAAQMFSFLPSRLLCRYKYDSLAHISDVGCPVFVAHSRDDTTVPFAHGLRLFNKAREPKRFFEMAGGHNSGGMDADPQCAQALADFLAEHLSAR